MKPNEPRSKCPHHRGGDGRQVIPMETDIGTFLCSRCFEMVRTHAKVDRTRETGCLGQCRGRMLSVPSATVRS